MVRHDMVLKQQHRWQRHGSRLQWYIFKWANARSLRLSLDNQEVCVLNVARAANSDVDRPGEA